MLFCHTRAARCPETCKIFARVREVSGADSRSGGRLSCFVALTLLLLVGPALVWGSFATAFKSVVTTLATGSVTLSDPVGIALDSLGNLYIADPGNNQIVEVSAAGVVSVLAFPGLSPVLSAPQAVAVDGSGNVFVTDSNNARIVELSGGVASVVATGGLLNYPDGLAFDAAGNLYIADANNNDIVKVPAGGSAASLVITGLGTALNQPGGLAVDVAGNLYIADGGNSRIVKVAPGGAGTVLSITGGLTLLHALAVAVEASGNVYIADTFDNRVVEVSPLGVPLVLSTGSDPLTQPRGIAVGVSGAVYIANGSPAQIVEVQTAAVDFGHVQLGSVSGTTLALPFSVANGTTLSGVQALTLGAPNLDFTVVTAGTTCVSGTTGTQSCNVNIQFLPTAAGLRRGAVVLYNNATPPVPIISVPLYATGDAPLAALSPGTATLAGTGGATLTQPFQIAFDGAGNMYVAEYGSATGNVVKVPAGGGSASLVSTAGFTLAGAIGVVFDGAGNLYISDHFNSRVVEVTAGGVVSALTITGVSPVLNITGALAMDQTGNLYISDYGRGRIVKVTPSDAGSVLSTGSFTFAANSVLGVAVDVAGTVYIPDSAGSRVVKVTAAGAASLVVPVGITPALSSPQGVAVDAFGNLYIADAGNRRIVEITTAGVASVVQMPGQSLLTDYGITVDTSGNVFIPDFSANHIVKVNVAGATLPAFPSTHVGQASSAQTATVTNLGDQPLLFAASPGYPADFSQPTGATNQCLISTSLASGTVCGVAVQFTPQSVGSLSESVVLTNDNLDVAGANQSIAVSGTGLASPDSTALTVSANPTSVILGQSISITAAVTDTAAGHTATVPTGGVTFMDTVGGTSVSLNGGVAVALDGSGTATLTGVVLSGAGSHTITANYAGVTNLFVASSNTTPVAVTKDPETIAGPSTQPVQITAGQSGSVAITVTGPNALIAPPSGSLSYTILDSSNTIVASGSAPLTAGTTDSTAVVHVAGSLAAGNYTVSVTYGGDSNYVASANATTVQLLVGRISPAISWTPPAGSITYGSTLSGVLTASAANGGSSVPGSFTYTATLQGGSPAVVVGSTVLGAGAYTLTVTFTPTDTTTYASASASVSLTVAKAAAAVALTSSAGTVLAANAITFTAIVSSVAGTPGGTVSFYDGAVLLGPVTLAQGVAAYTTLSLTTGAHTITAQYGGNSNFSSVTSSALTETVDDFSLSVAAGGATSATTTAGGTASYALIIAPTTGETFPAAVTLSVTGAPPGATATITPNPLPAGAGPTNVSLTIQLPSQTASLRHNQILALQLTPMMAGMLLLPLAVRIRRFASKGSWIGILLVLAIIGTSVTGFTGCGAKSSGFLGNQQTTYTLTLTATSGNLSHSTTLKLTVQ
ncbi:MAG TPA: Ig-like domain repeat protein [Candidatus Sulfotelmatobacter sp.]